MSVLLDLQRDFAAAMFDAVFDADAEAALARRCAGSPARVRAGMAAYRRSVLGNLAGAVEASCPVLARIVGERFLSEAARCYALERPSRSGDLNAYGSDFNVFLATWPPAADLPWLPDVARLEWHVQHVYGAPDAPPIDLAALSSIAPTSWDALRFTLDPGHAVVSSRWPLARIWEVNQPDYTGDMRVDFGVAQSVLVHRRGFRIDVERIAPGEAAFLKALSAGATLGEAVDAAMNAAASEADFDLAVALQRFLSCGLLRQALFPEP